MSTKSDLMIEQHASNMIAEIESEEKDPENWRKNDHAEEALSAIKTKGEDTHADE